MWKNLNISLFGCILITNKIRCKSSINHYQVISKDSVMDCLKWSVSIIVYSIKKEFLWPSLRYCLHLNIMALCRLHCVHVPYIECGICHLLLCTQIFFLCISLIFHVLVKHWLYLYSPRFAYVKMSYYWLSCKQIYPIYIFMGYSVIQVCITRQYCS